LNVKYSVLNKSAMIGRRDMRYVLRLPSVASTGPLRGRLADRLSRAHDMDGKYRQLKAELDELVSNMEGL
jgi:hypothetical protein